MKYVTLTTVDDIYHAHFLGQALEEKGILYIEANENTATLLPHLRQGIQIRVKETDYLKAKVICDKVEEMRKFRCPDCDSTNVRYLGLEARPLTLAEKILKLVHLPVTAQLLVYGCSNCGSTFKTK